MDKDLKARLEVVAFLVADPVTGMPIYVYDAGTVFAFLERMDTRHHMRERQTQERLTMALRRVFELRQEIEQMKKGKA